MLEVISDLSQWYRAPEFGLKLERAAECSVPLAASAISPKQPFNVQLWFST